MKRVAGEPSLEITGLAYHAAAVKPGFLFFAIRGFRSDGNQFVNEALGRGAAAVVSERPGIHPAAAWVQVTHDRTAMAGIAANFYSHPSREIALVGVTGTNGKTTTTFLLDSIFRACGSRTAMLGTIERRIGDDSAPVEHTTPESPDTQQFLRNAVAAGCQFASMEVSSHALELRRCDALQFQVAIFTNLTREHLDFHRTFEGYYHAKRRFFTEAAFGAPICVINRDDPYGERLWGEVAHEKVSFGLNPANEFRAEHVGYGPDGVAFRLSGKRNMLVESPLIGLPNVYNILGACAAALEMGLAENGVQKGVARLRSVPGRMERIANDRGIHLFVDFAHTNDALKNALLTARTVTRGRVFVVFGCGGDRDRGKRALMGEVAARYADFVALTSDNPRSEDPEVILDEIEAPLKIAATPYVRIADRREAIRHAIRRAGAGDVVILAGKGHEDCQWVGGQRIPFSDREEARRALEETR